MDCIYAVAAADWKGRPHALAGGDDGALFWDLTTGGPAQLIGTTSRVISMAVADLNGRSQVLTGCLDGVVRVWDPMAGTQVRELIGYEVAVTDLNGRPHAVTGGGNGTVRVWDLTTGDQVRELEAKREGLEPGRRYGSWVSALTVTQLDGRPHAIAAKNSDGWVWVWDLATGATAQNLVGHTSPVRALAAFQLHGRSHAITGGDHDHSVRLWDLATGRCVSRFELPDSVRAATIGCDGSVILSVGEEVAALSLEPFTRRFR